MPERYADVFRTLGLDLTLPGHMSLNLKQENFAAVRQVAGIKQPGQHWIGIAPFAAHPQKIYPLERMQQVIYSLADHGHRVFLFGAGKTESSILAQWEKDYATRHKSSAPTLQIVNISGALGGLKNEMLLMSQLDVMLSMDSANMHIASILGIPVISIWGATHPKAGFSGYGQDSSHELQLSLPCRPCSIYGKKPCLFGDLRCMNIAPEAIVNATLNLLQDTPIHA
jgi:ADP-heptose:LPS heptosyltransferase